MDANISKCYILSEQCSADVIAVNRNDFDYLHDTKYLY